MILLNFYAFFGIVFIWAFGVGGGGGSAFSQSSTNFYYTLNIARKILMTVDKW